MSVLTLRSATYSNFLCSVGVLGLAPSFYNVWMHLCH